MREKDVSVSDFMKEICTEESRRWWDAFTGYYDGILEESDGYLDEPTTLETSLSQERMLKIQFHPGNTLYYINGEKIGSTGPHWELQTFLMRKSDRYWSRNKDVGCICYCCPWPG